MKIKKTLKKFIRMTKKIPGRIKEYGNALSIVAKHGKDRSLDVIINADRTLAQLDYFKTHADITAMKPATGFLRKKQIDTVRLAEDFFAGVKEMDLHPFLTGASCIGAVRHKGFIPWNDILEFGLMCDEYDRLVEYNAAGKCPEEFELVISEDRIRVERGTSVVDKLAIEIYIFDHDRGSHRNYRDEDILPVQKCGFEDAEFYIPHNTAAFLEAEYPDYMDFPQDVGVLSHEKDIQDTLIKSVPTAEFYLVDAFEIYHFFPLYQHFNSHGIFARFVAEPIKENTSDGWFDYDEAIRILEYLGVRYSTEVNENCDFAFTTQKAYILKKYSGKKVHLSYGFGFRVDSPCESVSFSPGFDYNLIHGVASRRSIEEKGAQCELLEVGYPRYAVDFERNYADKEDIVINNPDNKPILVYFPTWNNYSSIDLYKDVIKRAREKFFVISKAHHCTYRLASEKQHLEALREISDVVLPGNYDFMKAARMGDIAVCDAVSGSTAEVPFVAQDIKLVLLYPSLDEYANFRDEINDFAALVKRPDDFIETLYDIWDNDVFLNARKQQLKDIYGVFGECRLDEITSIIKGNHNK